MQQTSPPDRQHAPYHPWSRWGHHPTPSCVHLWARPFYFSNQAQGIPSFSVSLCFLCWLPFKATRVDEEALVVTDETNGAFTLQLYYFCYILQNQTLTLFRPGGAKFVVPTKHFKTHTKCKKGDIVTFSYDRYAQDATPINVRVHRIRQDVTWEFIIYDHLKKVPKPQQFNGRSTVFWAYLIYL